MISSAPSEKETAAATAKKRLRDTADQFRANSGLKPQENTAPVLGLPLTNNAAVTRTSAKTKLPKYDRRNVGETEFHYLWIQLFHSELNEKGRAEFVMANAARNGHSYLVIISEAVSNYAAEPGIG